MGSFFTKSLMGGRGDGYVGLFVCFFIPLGLGGLLGCFWDGAGR